MYSYVILKASLSKENRKQVNLYNSISTLIVWNLLRLTVNFFYLLKGSKLVDYKGSSIEKVESQINLAHDGL